MTKMDDDEFTINMDVEGFHSFVKYLISRGNEPVAIGSRVRHWRRFTDVCRGT